MKNITQLSHKQDPQRNRDFVIRLKQIQSLLVKNSIPALLIINGEDGNKNLESNVLMNWLFQGTTHTEIETAFHLDPLFEETILLISQNNLEMFMSDDLYSTFESHFLVLTHKNLKIYQKPTQEKSRSNFEIQKSFHFFDFTQKHSQIAVILDHKSNKTVFVKDVENWPLIQMFALEGFLIRNRQWIFYAKEKSYRFQSAFGNSVPIF